MIDEIVSPDFTITSVLSPSKGTAMILNARELQWKIPELGVKGNEGASLEFIVRHVGQTSGTKLVNQSITYTDTEGNAVTFPTPVGDSGLRHRGPAGALSGSGESGGKGLQAIPLWSIWETHFCSHWAGLSSWM